MKYSIWQKIIIAMIVPMLFTACEFDSAHDSSGSSESGTGGSMARFTVKDNYLYSVDFNELHVFDIDDPEDMKLLKTQYVGFGIETIFPYEDMLFLGARDGMYIYDISNPKLPKKISFTPHFMSYDPVVVQGEYAYVTLRSENGFGAANVLQIYSLEKIEDPVLLKEYEMTGPRGLGIDGSSLFVCDDGLKVFEVTDGIDVSLVAHFDIPAIDVIPRGNRLYVVAESGFYQYAYSEGKIEFLSKIVMDNE